MGKSVKWFRINRSLTALPLALTLALAPSPLWEGGGEGTRAAPPQTPAQPSPSRAADHGWPRIYNLASGDSVVIYQPQIESWDNQKHVVAWAAVSYMAQGAKQAAPGAIKIEADTKVALDERLVNFSSLRITESNFPSLPRDQAGKVVTDLEKVMPSGQMMMSLDRVLAALDKSKIRPSSRDAAGLKADPPRIFHNTAPTVLVIFDGQPVWSQIQNVDLKFAVNTNWDVFEHTPSKTFYLRNDSVWLKAADPKGPLGSWMPAGKLPTSFNELPADDNWKDVRANLPGRQISANAVPAVFVNFEPAELILLTGQPQYDPVKGTSLLWVSNTESDVFRAGSSGLVYYLVAGRWFSAPSLDGPWTFATTSLPDDFKNIPLDHPRSRVLASVPGTDQAIEAVLLASIPQTARVNKKELKGPDVVYQGGTPEFKPIETTSLQRAVNTDKEIIKVGDLYYMLFQGVWFMSQSPAGPWSVTGSVPQEIYQIPASSPVYNVTYVTAQQDSHDSDWVTFAALAGYTGMMIGWGVAMWGTGWYYPPFIWGGGFYPYMPTYGMGAWYNPHTGTYGRGVAAYGPYGGAGGWSTYNPRTGTYSRGAAAYGPYNSRAFAQAYNPRTGTYGATRQGSNVYGNWGSSYVQRGDDWARTAHATNYSTGATTRAARTGGGGDIVTRGGPGGRTTFAQTGGGDMYAGHDGSVYRNQNGSWQKWSDGGWAPVQRSPGGAGGQAGEQLRQVMAQPGAQVGVSTLNQLNRDWSGRANGFQRMQINQNFQNFHAGGLGGRHSAGSFGGGFGGFRGRRR